MLKIQGYSDDIISIDGWDESNEKLAKKYHYGEVDCFYKYVKIYLEDGTIILCGYGKPQLGGIWFIKVLKQGTAQQTLTICENEDAEVYSDILEIDSAVKRIVVLPIK